MTDYSEFVIFFLMLPVVIQLITPLLMLIGYGLVKAVRAMFGGQNFAFSRKDDVDMPKDLQMSIR